MYWLTDWLTSWNKVLHEKLTVSELVKKFLTFCVTRRFIAVFTRILLSLVLNMMNPVHTVPNLFIIHNMQLTGIWACSQNCKKWRLALSCQSICSRGTTELPLDGFSWSLIFEYFQESVKKIQVSLKSDKNNGYFTWKPMYTFYHICLSLEWEMLQRKVVEKISTHILCSITRLFPSQKLCHLRDNGEKCARARHVTNDNMVHVHCMLDT
jgi:hypothetical protein